MDPMSPILHPSTHALPTPPDSPRKRRREQRSSDEVQGQLSIEDYLNNSDRYRTTTMRPPWPYPLTITPAEPSTVRQVEALKAPILQIMQDDGFPIDHHSFHFQVENVTKPNYPLGSRATTVLRLVFSGAPHIPGELGPTKDAIYQLIRGHEIRDVEVEIVFLDKCFQPSLFAIPSNHPAVAIYETAKRRILELVDRQVRNEWCLLSLFRLGLVKHKSTPTIVVFVSPFCVQDWYDLALQIKLRLPHNDSHAMGIDVEFIPGYIFTANPDTIPDGVSLVESMGTSGTPAPGTSITVLPERGGGTLGPFVTLQHQGNTIRGALTNFHVVRPPTTADKDIIEAAARFGSSPGNANQTALDVSWFAPRDVEKTKWTLKRYLKDQLTELKKEEQNIATCQMAGARVSDGARERLAGRTTAVAELNQQLAIVDRMPMKLGRTLVSSGLTIAENKVADWALIELDPEVFAGSPANFINLFPRVSSENRPYDAPDNDAPQQVTREAGATVDEIGPLLKDKWYCKFGRTTEVTGGICNGVSTYCKWPQERRQRFSKDGARHESITDGITEEWVITKENVGPRGRIQGVFSLDGDSGSGIIDREGRICGLLYGGAAGLCGHSDFQISGMCSSMVDVKRWIEERVGHGATLDFPHRNDS
ncbi:uncharacterized protein DSM5745_05038 [Aspergillus mulundensis]|uniref:Peptidase S1 domain-containing protein n=1 Tax=Aspergillus mulundensis TaxID=1810919 RepID=A0A3D8S5Y9_9EURO|nr:hypothetical protein DSM5745_05038 [Aspergillus mulundensis]RDW81481.1 hypothetical protein DSM5745_05038 [Aspergillus mulundensis]